MVHRIRRVVTGHDRDGKSIFVMDGKAPNILEMASMPGVALTDLWRTKTSPASNAGNADAATAKTAFKTLGEVAVADDAPALLAKLAGLKASDVRGEAESAAWSRSVSDEEVEKMAYQGRSPIN